MYKTVATGTALLAFTSVALAADKPTRWQEFASKHPSLAAVRECACYPQLPQKIVMAPIPPSRPTSFDIDRRFVSR
jgi:hypothetical protein